MRYLIALLVAIPRWLWAAIRAIGRLAALRLGWVVYLLALAALALARAKGFLCLSAILILIFIGHRVAHLRLPVNYLLRPTVRLTLKLDLEGSRPRVVAEVHGSRTHLGR